MCNFVPGQAIAVAELNLLQELGEGLPGEIEIRPLVTQSPGVAEDSPFARFGSATLRTEPGLEVFAISQLSARLAAAVKSGEAFVDLNHVVSLSQWKGPTQHTSRFTSHAVKEITSIRKLLRSVIGPAQTEMRIAVLDSGLSEHFAPRRSLRYFDYTANGTANLNATRADPIGHGTKVVRILDEILPPEIGLDIGRLPGDDEAITALTVAHACADIVARAEPEVLNLSVAPRSDTFVCRICRSPTTAPTFLSSFLPLIVKLCGRTSNRTITVMAAGNTGQVPNSRWMTDDLDTLLFATAQNSKGERTRYTSILSGPRADLFEVQAFGGDDPDDEGAQGVFEDGAHGTSFAAPFVSATVLLTKRFQDPPLHNTPTRLGEFTNAAIAGARSGMSLRMTEREGE